jgi:hypothetical protein
MKADDKRKFNGGHKTNGGRPTKSDEQKLCERLNPLEPIVFDMLEKAIKDSQPWAIKLFFAYNYGKPRETKEITINDDIVIDLSAWE